MSLPFLMSMPFLMSLGPLGPNSGVTDNWGVFETNIGLSGVENGGIGTKISINDLLVSEIW